MRQSYRIRKIQRPPQYQAFKPAGVNSSDLEKLVLLVDEFEAIRLADEQGHDHLRAAEMMHISRPTFSRLVEKARQKVARAIVKGCVLVIEGGHVEYARRIMRCRDCGREHNQRKKQHNCPQCRSDRLEDLANRYFKT